MPDDRRDCHRRDPHGVSALSALNPAESRRLKIKKAVAHEPGEDLNRTLGRLGTVAHSAFFGDALCGFARGPRAVASRDHRGERFVQAAAKGDSAGLDEP